MASVKFCKSLENLSGRRLRLRLGSQRRYSSFSHLRIVIPSPGRLDQYASRETGGEGRQQVIESAGSDDAKHLPSMPGKTENQDRYLGSLYGLLVFPREC